VTVKQITQVWTRFFAGSTPAAQKVMLLQSGSAFASVISAQAGTTIAKQTSAIVARVTLVSPDAATVAYSIALDGKVALPNQLGSAVRVRGNWQVSASSFCQLLKLEGQQPAACSATSQ
jgi:hypothetical protein